MRYNKYLLLGLFSLLMIINSCRDESTLVLNLDEIPHGIMVTIEITNPVLDVTDLANSAFEATLTAPSNNVATYILTAQLISTTTSDFEEVTRINNFPKDYDMSVSADDLATAFGIDLGDFLPGDQIDFYAYAIGDNGDTATWENLDQDLGTNPGQKQGFTYTTYVSCPFDANDAAGTYDVTRDDWDSFYDTDYTFDVVAGPEENQITLEDIFNFPVPGDPGATFDVTIDVDPETGIATVDRQAAGDFDLWVPEWEYGIFYIEGGGFVFSCTGTIVLSLEYSVGLGSWGPGWVITAVMQ